MIMFENGELEFKIPELPKSGIIDSATITMIAEKGRRMGIQDELLAKIKEQSEMLKIIVEGKYFMEKEQIEEFISQAKIIRQDEYQVPGKGIAMPDFISGPKYDKWMNSIKIFADRNLKEHELYENIIKTYEKRNSLSLSRFDDMLGFLETINADDAFFNNTHKGEDKNMSFIDYSKDSVFVVHGHDNEAKEKCARFLERIGLKPIILHEQPSSGKTIIEKIEKYSDVGFAIVLYTPCDDGKSKKVDSYKDRARQNVVFEHGYMIAKLGRDRVSALVKGSIETPGDISGVVYIEMDSGDTWKLALAREMKDIGFDIDMNKI